MYSTQTRLFYRPLERELTDELDQHISKIQKAGLAELEKLSSMESRLGVPSLCRSDVELKTSSSEGGGVSVAVSVPVEGDEKMLELAPTRMRLEKQLLVTMSDDLEWMLDGRTEGGTYHSDRWDEGASSEGARGGFLFRERFTAGVSTDDVRERVRGVIDWVEETLRFSSQEIQRFERVRAQRISDAVQKRRSALETATRLDDELGRGI